METFLTEYLGAFLLLIIWTIIWKGMALWRAAKLNHKWWFIALLVINTVGLLEVFYFFTFGKRKA